tara:strand:- start:303 stop:719 length:417 start_codon:yes stop_codon:yes gene_type:complete
MEYKSETGAKVVINPADWKDAVNLKSAIAKELSKSDVKIELDDLTNASDISEFIKLFLVLDSSEVVYDNIFKCLARCTYHGEKITEDTFEDIKAREDYYEITFHCIKENLNPFFKGLRSRLSQLMLLVVPKSKDESPK